MQRMREVFSYILGESGEPGAAIIGGGATSSRYGLRAATRSRARLRMVPVPGGFAFVEVASGAEDRVAERRGLESAA